MSHINKNNLIWIDLEMTGLDPEANRIIEIATIITDSNLTIIAEGPVFAIHQEQTVLNAMDNWNVNQHTKSGLIRRVKESVITETEAAHRTLQFLRQYVPENCSPMCGNTICQDRRFLARYMPDLEKFFHYRHLDVSTVKILAQRWAPTVTKGFTKESTHLALQDIRDSIDELKYYRDHLFIRVN